MSNKTDDDGPTLVSGLVFIAIGVLIALVFGLPKLGEAKASAGWPSVKGVVLKSKLKTFDGGPTRTGSDSGSSAFVSYKYSVDGVDYHSDQIDLNVESNSDYSYHEDLVKRFSKNKKIDVFYNPEEPSMAVLIPGANSETYLMIGIGVLFALVGIFLVGLDISKRKSQS